MSRRFLFFFTNEYESKQYDLKYNTYFSPLTIVRTGQPLKKNLLKYSLLLTYWFWGKLVQFKCNKDQHTTFYKDKKKQQQLKTIWSVDKITPTIHELMTEHVNALYGLYNSYLGDYT